MILDNFSLTSLDTLVKNNPPTVTSKKKPGTLSQTPGFSLLLAYPNNSLVFSIRSATDTWKGHLLSQPLQPIQSEAFAFNS